MATIILQVANTLLEYINKEAGTEEKLMFLLAHYADEPLTVITDDVVTSTDS